MQYPFKIFRSNDHDLRQQISAMGDWIWEYATKIWNDSLALFTAAAYGGVRLVTPDPTFPDIGIAWETVRFDADAVTAPRGVIQDNANNGIRFTYNGVFLINLGFTFKFTESQAGRDLEARIYNADTAVGGQPTIISVGRNQDGLNFSTSVLAEIPDTELNDLWQLQVGGAPVTLAGVTQVSAVFNATSVSEFRE